MYRTIRSLSRNVLNLFTTARLFSIPAVMCAAMLSPLAAAASPLAEQKAGASGPQASQQQKQSANVPEVVLLLQKRINAATAAQQTGDPEAVTKANKELLGVALRAMAHLRLLEDAYPQSVELYKRSLEFEDIPEAHVDLAIAYLRMKRPSESLAEADKAIFSTPQDARAWNIEGRAWMMLRDYRNAAKYLARSIAIDGNLETAYALATCLLALKEKDKAAMVFQEMVASAGDRSSLHVAFGRAYRDGGFMEDAVKEFRKALSIDPKTPHAHYFIGLVRLIQNEWGPLPEIRQEMLEELKNNPRDYLANYVLGVFTSNEKKYEESEGYLKVSSEEDPDSPETWLYMGLNAYSQNDYKKAEELLRKAVALTGTQESRSHYQIRKAYIALGRILNQTGRKDEGAVFIQKAKNVQQLGIGESQQSIAEVFSRQNSGMGAVVPYISPEKEEAAVTTSNFIVDHTAQLGASALGQANLTDQEKVLAAEQEKLLRPILASSYNDLGTAEARQRRYAPALAYFREAERWDAQLPNLLRNIGVAAVRVANYSEATRALSAHITGHPDDAVARGMLGLSYYMSDAFPQATKTIAPLGDAIFSDQGLALAWAASLAKTGQLKEAAAALEKLQQQQLSSESLLLVGQTWADMGDYERAVQVFGRASAESPSLPSAHFYSGLAYIRANRPVEASKEFQAELAINPDDAEAKYNLGYTFLLQSNIEKAAEVFRSVISAHPEHGDAQYQLGKIMLDQNEVQEAISHLEMAARLVPQKDFVHYQLQAAYRKASRTEDADRELEVYKDLKAKNREKTLPQPTEHSEAKQ